MNDHSFDTFAERAARGISRRASLMTLGTAGLAAVVAAPFSADAKNKKKCKKKDKKCPSLEEICAPQVEDCRNITAAVCGNDPGCDRIVDCCEVFETCDVGAFIVCLSIQPPEDTAPR